MTDVELMQELVMRMHGKRLLDPVDDVAKVLGYLSDSELQRIIDTFDRLTFVCRSVKRARGADAERE